MADIKQAAKWMQEGKKVTRSKFDRSQPTPLPGIWAPSIFLLDGTVCCTESWVPVIFNPDALLADDWEIAE